MNHVQFKGTAARIAVFALAAGLSTFAQAQNPGAAEDYTSLSRKIDALSDKKSFLKMQEVTQDGHATAETAATIKAVKKDIAAMSTGIAPAILLTPGLSADDANSLIERYTRKVGDTPAYLTAVVNKTASLAACQDEGKVTADTPKTDAAAQAVSDCVVAHKDVAAAPKQQAAPVVAVAPPAPVTKAAPVAPAVVPAPVAPAAPVTAAAEAKPSTLPFGLTIPEAAGGAGGVLILLAVVFTGLARRSGGKSTPAPAPTATATPAPAPAAAAPRPKEDDFKL